MNNQLLQNNIRLLKNYGYGEELIQNLVLEIEKNKQGYDNIHYQIEEGKKIYIHSQYNIERELDMLENSLNIKEKDYAYIVYGLGLGYHIKSLKEKIGRKSIIFVIEKNMDIISTYMHTQDFSEIAGKNVVFLFGDDEKFMPRFSEIVFSINVLPVFVNVTNVILPSYLSIYGDWINTMQKKIMDTVRHAFFMLGNDMEDTIIGIQNNLENIDEILKSPSIRELKNSYKNVPLFIISAGPSLDKNICELKNAQGKSLIIATDAVLSTLKKHGITPDGVVSIERVLVTYEKFYKGKEIPHETVFIGPPVVRPEIFEALKDNKKLVCLKQGERVNEWINEIVGDERTLYMGTSCAHIAFSFGRHVGANPIVFVGQDLAYTKDGITHSENVEIKKRIDTEKNKKIVYVKGIDGDLLPSNRTFKQFLTWFELEIAKSRGDREYIDATEGGAYIQGTKLMTLKETIEKYCNNMAEPLHEKVSVCEINTDKYDEVIGEIEKLIASFEKINEESKMHIIRLDKLNKQTIRYNKAFSPKDKEKILKVTKQAKIVEKLIINKGVEQFLFQAPYVTAISRICMLGNNLDDDKLKEIVMIQRKLCESVYLGSRSAIAALSGILNKMKINRREENERTREVG